MTENNNDTSISTLESSNTDETLPILRKISCPVNNCSCFLSEVDLNPLSEYHQAYSVAFSNIYSRRACSLYSILNCDPIPTDLNKLVCLGCSHFYHPDCFFRYVYSEINNPNNQNEHIVCYQCRVENKFCDCLECYNRVDKTSSGEHILNEMDMKLFEEMLLNDELRKLPNEEKGEYESKVKSLSNIWYQRYEQKSISAVSQKSGYKLFECICGEKYEVEYHQQNLDGDQNHNNDNDKTVHDSDQQKMSCDIAVDKNHESMNEESKNSQINKYQPESFTCPNPSCRKVYCSKVKTYLHFVHFYLHLNILTSILLSHS